MEIQKANKCLLLENGGNNEGFKDSKILLSKLWKDIIWRKEFSWDRYCEMHLLWRYSAKQEEGEI